MPSMVLSKQRARWREAREAAHKHRSTARSDGPMERPTCRIYTAATDALYLPGAATLVHSIQRLAQLPCSITLLFHPSVADSKLSRENRSLLSL